jgi:Flp pilus assembly pilin Flp
VVVTGTHYGATLRPTNWLDRVAELRVDTRGALLVEYSVLIGVIAIAGSLGLVLVGLALVHSFDFVRGLLLCPIP